MSSEVTQQQIVTALQNVPPERWGIVLQMLDDLKPPARLAHETSRPVRTGKDLVGSDLIGLWANRTDIDDRHEFSRQLRHQASHRELTGKSDAPGH